MDGTISLGIYDQTGKIVRILHQNAQLNDFAIGADALVTRWDGKDDGHQDSPSGRYHARGYLVGPLKREDLNETSPPSTQIEANVVKVDWSAILYGKIKGRLSNSVLDLIATEVI